MNATEKTDLRMSLAEIAAHLPQINFDALNWDDHLTADEQAAILRAAIAAAQPGEAGRRDTMNAKIYTAKNETEQKQLARAEADKIGGQCRTRRGTDGFGNPVLEVIDREGRKVGQVFQGKDTSAQAIAERMLADI